MTSLIAHLKETADVMNAAQIGSPEAIAACQRRREDAIRRGQKAIDDLDAKLARRRDEAEPLNADDYETGHEQDEQR